MRHGNGQRRPQRAAPRYGRDVAKKRGSGNFKGQLMLQIAAGRFFRPGVPTNEHTHRRTVYSNAWFAEPGPHQLPVGSILGSTELGQVSTAMLEAVDRLEARRPDGTDDFMIATGGDDLIDDIAYVLTFVLNRTFSRDHDQVLRLVAGKGGTRTRREAAALFPGLFEPQQMLQAGDLEAVRLFMDDLLALAREDFARAMRVIRSTIDASRRALDDPTGAYTDLVAALESIGDDHLTARSTWDRYDGRKRKIIDAALKGANDEFAEDVRAAVLEADCLGLKRRFVSSTLARVSDAYFRDEAVGAVRPPRSADLERMLSIAYDIRSRRSHVLEDLSDEAWVFTDGAETVLEPRFRHILTLAGLWRLVRHVARRFVAEAPKPQPEPWDYRATLPGIIQAQLAPQYWVWQANGLDANTAEMWLSGVAEAFISWYSGHTDDGIDLTPVVDRIESIVPAMTDGPAKTAMVAIYALWNDWTDPGDRRSGAAAFLEAHGACLTHGRLPPSQSDCCPTAPPRSGRRTSGPTSRRHGEPSDPPGRRRPCRRRSTPFSSSKQRTSSRPRADTTKRSCSQPTLSKNALDTRSFSLGRSTYSRDITTQPSTATSSCSAERLARSGPPRDLMLKTERTRVVQNHSSGLTRTRECAAARNLARHDVAESARREPALPVHREGRRHSRDVSPACASRGRQRP